MKKLLGILFFAMLVCTAFDLRFALAVGAILLLSIWGADKKGELN